MLKLVAAESKEKKEAKPAAEKAAPAKPKPPAKAAAKPLPQLMEEDVIPSLKAILEAQDDISELQLSFGENRVSPLFLTLMDCFACFESFVCTELRIDAPTTYAILRKFCTNSNAKYGNCFPPLHSSPR